MSWLPMIALAAVAFAVAAFLVKLPKSMWSLFGAALLFGLAGYAIQGTPGYSGAPKQAESVASEGNFALIEARREFFDPERAPGRFVTVADGFARQGKYQDAANMLGNAVAEDPNDAEAWVAMGNALIEHAEGTPTPAALYAYSRAEQVAPGNPAPAYFLGIGFLRAGQPGRTRALWAELLENAPKDAPWRADLESRLERLDQLIAQIGQ